MVRAMNQVQSAATVGASRESRCQRARGEYLVWEMKTTVCGRFVEGERLGVCRREDTDYLGACDWSRVAYT
jgi:hypothetical protein